MELQVIRQEYLIDFTVQIADISNNTSHLTLYSDAQIQEQAFDWTLYPKVYRWKVAFESLHILQWIHRELSKI